MNINPYEKGMKMNGKYVRKGKTIGAGKPLLCAPIVEDTREGILSEFRSLLDTPADMIEWRADLYEGIKDTGAVLDILERLSDAAEDKLLLFTCRSVRQGGNCSLTGDETEVLLKRVAQSGCVDLLDFEYFMLSDPGKFLRELKDNDVIVVASHHDFEETPPPEAMLELLSYMAHGGADIVKLAVMPHDMDDVLRLLSITERFRREFPDVPVISMSMGKYGMLSRLCGEFFGIAVTFAAHSRSSAPGQIDLSAMSVLLDRIHRSCGEMHE